MFNPTTDVQYGTTIHYYVPLRLKYQVKARNQLEEVACAALLFSRSDAQNGNSSSYGWACYIYFFIQMF